MKPLSHDATFTNVVDMMKHLIAAKALYGFTINMGYHTGQLYDYSRKISIVSNVDGTRWTFVEHAGSVAEVSNNIEFIDKVNVLVGSIPAKPTDWDRRFLRLAAGEVNTWSKDPSTKVSAVVVNGKHPVAHAYNGFPPGIEDTYERLNNRELKYKLVQHAEANAISTCAKLGISTNGLTMAVTHFPCSTCAGMMISAGIKKVIVQEPTEDLMSRWRESIELSRQMFDEAGIDVVIVNLDEEVEG